MEGKSGTQSLGGTHNGQTLQGMIGTCVQDEGKKGGSHLQGKHRNTKACIVGRRDKQQKLAGGGCRQCLGGRRFVPGEELRGGRKKRGIN